jgi:PIN domain nuclease of toxin-antitoxin system
MLDEVGETGEVLTILKRGRPVAQVVPPAPRAIGMPQDMLRGTVEFLGDVVGPVLLDRPSALTDAQRSIVDGASEQSPLLVSDITLWEIATLMNLRRLRLHLPLRDWLEAAVAPPLVRRIAISPAVAAETASLPASFHGDPADRMIVASARIVGATLLTQDRRILESGLVATL